MAVKKAHMNSARFRNRIGIVISELLPMLCKGLFAQPCAGNTWLVDYLSRAAGKRNRECWYRLNLDMMIAGFVAMQGALDDRL